MNGPNRTYFTITTENDLFASGNDHSYTNGVRLSWFEVGKRPPTVSKGVQKKLSFLGLNDSTTLAYSLGHNLYTPVDIQSETININDRPWAAFFYGAVSMATLTGDHLDEYEIMIGVVGPSARGEALQKQIHKVIDSPTPLGWDGQLNDEVGLVLSKQRRWPGVWQSEWGEATFVFTPHLGASVGNIYTYINAGGVLKYSLSDNRWHDTPLLARPAMPGTGYFLPADKMGLDVFVGLEGRAIARNIFLDGNTFANSYRVKKNPFVADVSLGFSLTYKEVRLSYTSVYRTKEFHGQEEESIFGAFSFGWAF
ncbi:MAG: lipid A deacylase LpxR family protein [Planctomycetota bacterium]